MAQKTRSDKTIEVVTEPPGADAGAEEVIENGEALREQSEADPAASAGDAAGGEAAAGDDEAAAKPKRRRSRSRSKSSKSKTAKAEEVKAEGEAEKAQEVEPDAAPEVAVAAAAEGGEIVGDSAVETEGDAEADAEEEHSAEGGEAPGDEAEEGEREAPARAGREQSGEQRSGQRRDQKSPRQSRTSTSKAPAAKPAAAKTGKLQMLISYIPGEECRIAVVEDGKLEEFHAERASSISRVGNIYVGRVTNVEPAIQAAFVDFGVDHHGFLHVSDVHPRYFPGEDDETTESVGKKTPRRERPPIQKCFRRGDEVLVQVLKEGVGTKGPTLTSYLSVPGRFLVMMPQMDKVGVSRKVEDEDQRREMRKILDQLDLPEGFGFILRTAGMDRTKMELKRDLAYLLRLWKDMETRKGTGNKPRLLYSESDLLVRALRDILAPEIDEVVIDNELALARAARFLKIVAPRSKVGLLQYQGQTPLFHAFGIEQQIAMMHAREVPLPSGGRLVIDETEALVAIDVNSGKMRDSRDAETNAYRTNCEAVEVICRQLKLRDLGGIVINDLIDMRLASHRKDVEQRFRDRLKRDRARSTILPISGFGILEMTRQRMRGSHETVHFGDCPTCRGRGIVQKPDSVASDALRNLAALLDHGNVARVEMVVSPRVASELLSSRRKSLNKLERTSGKHVDVRVSETMPIDRISFYAYDSTGADIDVEALPRPKAPKDLKMWELPRAADDEVWVADLREEETVDEPDLTPGEQAELADMPAHPIEIEDSELDEQGGSEGGEGGRKRRRRRRRRGGRSEDGRSENGQAERSQGGRSAEAKPAAAEKAPGAQPAAAEGSRVVEEGEAATAEDGEGGEVKRRRRRRRRRRGGDRAPAAGGDEAAVNGDEAAGAPEEAESVQATAQEDLNAPRGDSWDLPPAALPRLMPTPAVSKPGAGDPESVAKAAAEAANKVDAEADEEADEAAEADDASGTEETDAKREQSGEPSGEPSGDQGGERSGGRGRRRRRGRGGRRDGEPKNDSQREVKPAEIKAAERPMAKVPERTSERAPEKSGARAPEQRPAGRPASEKGEVRVGGGYRKKSETAPVAKPASSRASTPGTPAAVVKISESGSRPAPAPKTGVPATQSPPPPAAQPPAPGSGQPAMPKRVLYTSRRKLTPAELARRPKPE